MNNCANTASVAFLRMLNEHDCDIFIIPINEYIVMPQRGKRIQSWLSRHLPAKVFVRLPYN